MTIALKSTGVGFSFWNKCFLKKGNGDEIETTSRLSFTLCLSEFIYVEFQNKHIGEDYGPDSLKEMTTLLVRQCTKSTEPEGFLLYRTENYFVQGSVDGKAKQLHLAGRRKRPSKARQVSLSKAEEHLWKR